MITTVLLIRHGQTDWNKIGRWQGHTDIPLNDRGHQQARLLAHRLATWPISVIYTSDLKRAVQTADPLGAKLGLVPIKEPALRERNGGFFQGLTREELQARFGEEWRRVRQDGLAPPNGESDLDLAMRVEAAFQQMVNRHKGDMIAMISHGGALKVLISHILGLPLGQPAPFSLSGNTGLSIVKTNENGSILTLLNDVSHLENDHIEGLADLRDIQ
jgi:broad specificity phosphatase PhoE